MIIDKLSFEVQLYVAFSMCMISFTVLLAWIFGWGFLDFPFYIVSHLIFKIF